MKLPKSRRNQFKKPLGQLIPESQTNKENIKRHLKANSYIITVGDRTTEKMIEYGLMPSLQIIDSQEKRVKREPPKSNVATDLTCDNPAAEITNHSIDLIKKAFSLP